jgi:aldose 1-epimerase
MVKQFSFFSKIAFIFCIGFCYQCEMDKKEKLDMNETIKNKKMTITQKEYAITDHGDSIDCYTLKNVNGVEVSIINYGGIITSIKAPNKKGVFENIVLGYDSLAQYIETSPYFGAIVGRYGNRIANGQFSLDGKEYSLAKNNGPNSLHGGLKGFDKVVWNAATISNDDSVSLVLRYLSKDMEEGFPGNLETTVTYTLNSDNKLDIVYEATTDIKTIVNLTNHSYFNLSGSIDKNILDHQLQIDADSLVPVDEFMIPTGEIARVENTPFDFRMFKAIGDDIDADNEQLKLGSGYDHCWVLNNQNEGFRLIASVYHESSGRELEVFSDEPGVQLYTGNHLEGLHGKRTGFCLETQHYPDSPNQLNFPSVVLKPNEKYSSKTSYKFSVK